MSETKPPWKKPRPSVKPTHLSASAKARARARARNAGRAYPNLVDNMWAARQQKKTRAKRPATAKRPAKKKKPAKRRRSTKTAALRDPRGGLTPAGRAHFARTEGAHLRPGVRGKVDSPDKMRRKGSFLRRHFAKPRGPMRMPDGTATRLALSAHAWGEPVPKTPQSARRLADEGTRLLARYQRSKAASR